MPQKIVLIRLSKRLNPFRKIWHTERSQRILDWAGLEPWSEVQIENRNTKNKNNMEKHTGSTEKEIFNDRMSDKKKGGLGLPMECESAIAQYLPTADLLALSLVSKHLRDLAAEEIYRSFHIVFPSEEHDKVQCPVDSLAAGLNTFVTSDYNYSRHLKEIILEPLLGGEKSEQDYRAYLYDTTCGKFLNTMLLLTLRKTEALETFKWDIRVELSKEVLKELHRIDALQHFHVRMQAVRSISASPTNPSPTSSTYNASIPIFPHHLSVVQSSITAAKTKQSGSDSRSTVNKGMSRTISGFKNLKTLSVLDMDNLHYLSEIQECIENSSTTLYSLKLSFSEELASRSRKPSPQSLPADDVTETEDYFGPVVQAPGSSQDVEPDTNSFSKVLRAAQERRAHEAALGKIFGIEPSSSKGGADSTTRKEGESEREQKGSKGEAAIVKMFLDIPKQAAKYMAEQNFTVPDDIRKSVQALIEKALQPCVETLKKRDEPADKLDSSDTEEVSGEQSKSSIVVNPVDEGTMDVVESQDEPSLFDESKTATKAAKFKEIVDPDDIDIEEPEAQEFMEDLETLEGVTTGPETNSETVSMEAQGHQASEAVGETTAPEPLHILGVDSAEKAEQTSKQVDTNSKGEPKGTETHINDANNEMSEYIRKTRGLALRSLSIYLIPLRTSVITKAIDISVLRSITLLEVGGQTSFWNLIARENKVNPLPLHEIYTDHVTLPFLECVGQLRKVTMLCMLERPSKKKVESTAVSTTVTMAQIRKLVLKKHAPTLKVLSIHQEKRSRLESSFAWDLDTKSAVLLCRSARNLEELAAAFDVSIMHIINQNLSGLKNLRALHAIDFRSEDTCFWVSREFRKFTVDSIAHNPDCKLEYIALKNSIIRLFRRVKRCPLPKLREVGLLFGKAKSQLDFAYQVTEAAAANGGSGSGSGAAGQLTGLDLEGQTLDMALGQSMIENILDINTTESPSSEDEDDYDDEFADEVGVGSMGMKVESVDGFKFHDIQGVRIFEKDVVWKRL
ncbi:hypothetical protein SBOR_4184 [Sclerotinia borealis F-4128]|uniref:F-box domain-containing protein n=1 Tax=Sclerotinia borealis (strain F-4128) TaxID=1432307 RepID=W9CHL2_SCLBF|nr:hypothetical protein SBOR_4184 [Sclerotinia borealis F-4128]